MPMLRKILVLATALTMAAPAASHAANTAPLPVPTSLARILRISAPAATVIIGTPGVADVTIQDPQTLVLTGKSYGETNLIILDSSGNPIADTMISLIQATPDAITMYMGTARTTLSCLPVCQSTVTLGDDNAFSTGALASSTLLQGAATAK